MSYDPKCQDLAEYFLSSGIGPRSISDLAQSIQDAVENWIQDQRRARIVAKLAPRCQHTTGECDWPDCPCGSV